MIVVPLESDKKSISNRFRKSEYLALIEEGNIKIIKNEHKRDKSNQFLEYFNTLNAKAIIVKNLGYNTFKKLKVDVFFTNASNLDELDLENLIKIDDTNAKDLCTLGHKK